MIKAIIFDIGGVVTKTNFKDIYTGFAQRVGLEPDFVKQYHADNRDDLSIGAITLQQVWEAMKAQGGQADDFTEVFIEEGLKYRVMNDELFSIIEQLRKKYIVGALTNLHAGRQALDERMDIYSHFDFAILSCQKNKRKPFADFYELALEAAKVKPEEAVFIDDKEEYIKGAQAVGMHAIQYTFPNNEELMCKLGELGVTL